MHIDHPVESFEQNVLDLDFLANTRIVDKDIYLAQRRLRLRKERVRRRSVADIAAARSFRQLRRFHHVINPDKVNLPNRVSAL
jgi:hypothetical protein